MAPTSKKAKFAGPFKMTGPAVERVNRVKEQNDAPRSNESEWLERAESQKQDIASGNVEFFTELKRRIKDA